MAKKKATPLGVIRKTFRIEFVAMRRRRGSEQVRGERIRCRVHGEDSYHALLIAMGIVLKWRETLKDRFFHLWTSLIQQVGPTAEEPVRYQAPSGFESIEIDEGIADRWLHDDDN